MISSLANFKNSIFQNEVPVVFAMDWNSAYNADKVTGILPLPTGTYVGGHAICAVGWDKEGMWVKNSWGEDWGQAGHFKILFKDWPKHVIYSPYVLLNLPKKTNMILMKSPEAPHVYLISGDGVRKIMIIDYPTFESLGQEVEVVSQSILDKYVDGGTIVWVNRIIN